MAIPVLIIGKSGSGKSTSLRNFKHDELCLINVLDKPLPFRGKFDHTYESDDYGKIKHAIAKTDKNAVCIDDAGFLITNMFMKFHSSTGGGNSVFTLYNDIADQFWGLIEYIKTLDKNKIVYIVMHEDKNDMGDIKPKTIGKLLDEKVCLEGLFTIVIRCVTDSSGKHKFLTETDGKDVTKAPMGMFVPEMDNDLKVVDEKIREYYNLAPLTSKEKEEKKNA